jgi:hypothetical protein
MHLAILMTWATFGLTGAVDPVEPPDQSLPAPQPLLIEAPQAPMKTEQPPPPPLPKIEQAPPSKVEPSKEPAKAEPSKEPAKAEQPKEAAKTEPAAPTQAAEPLLPPYPAFMDPRAFAWAQHRLPPPDQPCLEIACQLKMCLGDHRCHRERICDLLFNRPCCPGPGLCGKRCPTVP